MNLQYTGVAGPQNANTLAMIHGCSHSSYHWHQLATVRPGAVAWWREPVAGSHAPYLLHILLPTCLHKRPYSLRISAISSPVFISPSGWSIIYHIPTPTPPHMAAKSSRYYEDAVPRRTYSIVWGSIVRLFGTFGCFTYNGILRRALHAPLEVLSLIYVLDLVP